MQSTLLLSWRARCSPRADGIPVIRVTRHAGPLIVVTAVAWVFLMTQALLGQRLKLPYIGDLAEQELAQDAYRDPDRLQRRTTMTMPTDAAVLDALRVVRDPDLHKDIVALGFVKKLQDRRRRGGVHDRADDAGVSGQGSDARSGAARRWRRCRA